jgi:catechol 2,3-dioxygenase-like lactoylglutathione lyase family enzyme
LVGINHIAPEVGDVAAALDFYGSIFTFELRGSRRDDGNRVTMAFLDMGGQFFGIRRVFPNKGGAGRIVRHEPYYGRISHRGSQPQGMARKLVERLDGDPDEKEDGIG